MIARKFALTAALLSVVYMPAGVARAWGPEGHVIVARIAELNLNPEAKQAVADLLPDTPFSGSNAISESPLASYADFVRHNSSFPQYGKSGPWHFVDIPVDPQTAFDASKYCKDDQCALGQIERFKSVLANKAQDKSKRQEALVFLVHLVGDLSQPLHCATRNDTGGNDLKVKYLGNPGTHHPLNLHSVWDSNLVRENLIGFDPVKTAEKLNEGIENADRTKWQSGTVEDWMMDSYEVARTAAYRQADGTELPRMGHPNLDENYVKANRAQVAQQLKKGGVRLAKVLNEALAQSSR